MTNGSLPGTRGRKRLYLMRHGEVSYHRPDGRTVFSNEVDLTEEGVTQAQAMAATLKEVEFDFVGHTGLLRTRHTAEIVLAGREIGLRTIPELIEIQGGSIEGMSEERLEAEFVYGLERAAMPGANFAGGETFTAFQRRVIGAVEQLVREPQWHTALVVAHGATNAMVLGWVTQGGLNGLGAFEQDAGCVNIIDVDVIDGEIIRRFIRALNVTPYNLPKLGRYLTVTEHIVSTRKRP